MLRRRLIGKLLPSHLLLLLAAVLLIGGITDRAIRHAYRDQTSAVLHTALAALSPGVQELMTSDKTSDELQDLARHFAESDLRVTVILPSGVVVADSSERPELMENHAERPEVKAVLAGATGESLRRSSSLDEMMQYLAAPIMDGERLVGILRVAYPMSFLDRAVWNIRRQTGFAALALAILALVASWVTSKRILRPIEKIKLGAERFAQGELDQRLSVPGSEEIASVADALNQMASQLNDRMRAVVRQRNEQEAVLSSMGESVLAVDRAANIISMNRAAAELLGVNPARVQGQTLEAAVRNTALREFVGETLKSDALLAREIVLHARGEQVLQCRGTALRDDAGQRIGAVIVLDDVTHIRRLEKIRREFVANVSHELKTPITSIKGFVETLLDGAKDQPEDLDRFLGIIAKQADRLDAIIEDLLTLSRVEQDKENGESLLQSGSINMAVKAAVQLCAPAAKAKRIGIVLDSSESLEGRVNLTLLEQAVVNLVNNAIKYSDEGRSIWVSLERLDDEALIHVRDEGCGIAAEHLPRLFERFYRVDKDRSRRLGGTGLGLSIVKHIAEMHQGRIEVQSRHGVGSTFTLHIALGQTHKLAVTLGERNGRGL